jgi:hypothetical protein
MAIHCRAAKNSLRGTIGFTKKHLFNEAIKIAQKYFLNVDEGIHLVSNSLIQSVDTKIRI